MGVESAEKIGVDLLDKGNVIYKPLVKVKTALKGRRLERAEHILDVACKPKEKKKAKPEDSTTPSRGNGDGLVGV